MNASSFRTGFEGSKIAPFEFEGILVRVGEHIGKMDAVWS